MSEPRLLRHLFELEQDLADTDITELGEFLEACGYEPAVYEEDWTVVYYHAAWNSRLTFLTNKRSIPTGYLRWILTFVRSRITTGG